MQLSPRFNETLLPPRQRTSDQLNRIDGIDRHCILMVRVKVRPMMRRIRFSVHTDYDTIETSDLWHNSSPPMRAATLPGFLY